ncbi:LETM1-like protein [Cordyceps fumosorosea ARSEF 2679]|uniref:LETM1-like protein n=1 Tax=Cordyceps fumosorosea (strain ARSEF 2679) TaxID=1081104 RepID=A0A167TLX4_CORFA|nr:LETM1-like protein [Cordyceps fumosorosea ARSEF 2679]OAA60733.1 LETM1-like protein [Cordyceps fumosorosea ARSEF 2679]
MSSGLAWRCHARSAGPLSLSRNLVVLPNHNALATTTTPTTTRIFSPHTATHHGRPLQYRNVHHTAPPAASRSSKQSLNPLLNPPASTRPPVLETVQRSAHGSTPAYLFHLGKSYLRFYKDGLKAVFANRRLLRERLARTPADDRPSSAWSLAQSPPRSFSRADWVLLWRVRHDMIRLPCFGLLFVICGEFSPLVVMLVDGIVPYPCRIPQQLRGAAEKAEARRRAAFRELEVAHPHGVLSPRVTRSVARRHVLRSLHLSGAMWDRLTGGMVPPGMWRVKGALRMAFLEGDDEGLVRDGGPVGLEVDELRIACMERGIDVLGKSESEMRTWLGDWLRLTAAEDLTERRQRMTTLLMTRQESWPHNRDFAVPEWHL